jgi:hypothetical protein
MSDLGRTGGLGWVLALSRLRCAMARRARYNSGACLFVDRCEGAVVRRRLLTVIACVGGRSLVPAGGARLDNGKLKMANGKITEITLFTDLTTNGHEWT